MSNENTNGNADGEKNVEVADGGQQTKVEEKEKKKISSTTILLVIIILLLMLIVGGILFIIFNDDARDKFEDITGIGKSNELDVDNDSVIWEGDKSNDSTENVSSDTITVPGYPVLEFPSGEKKVTCNFVNPKGNPCYFKFTLILKDTQEVLCETKMVPPGNAVTECELSKVLEPGEYEAVIQIDTYDLETVASLNGANVNTKIVIK